MQISIKNLKHSVFASRETTCFEATVYVNGIKTFLASNDGQGGSNRYYPVSGKSNQDIQPVSDWAKTLPKVETEFGDLDDDLDFYISRLVDREISKRSLKSLMKKRVVYYDIEQGLLMNAVSIQGISVKDWLAKKTVLPESFTTGKLILADIDFEQAVDFFVASHSTKKMAAIYRSIL